MTDIMKLADDYIAQLLPDVGRQYGFRRVTATTDGKARAALQSAIEALQAENERLTREKSEDAETWRASITEREQQINALQAECAEHKENAIRNARQAVAFRAERDQLQAKLDELQGQEPVAIAEGHVLLWIAGRELDSERDHYLYAAPKALEPLTDKQAAEGSKQGYDLEDSPEIWSFVEGVRFAEKHHGITKGTP